jgi:hypothetical protein
VDLGATELFVEVLVAGVLFTFGLSPILIYFSDKATERGGLLPGINSPRANSGAERTGSGESKLWIVLVIALIYSVGIAGNRLVEDLYKRIHECFETHATWVLTNPIQCLLPADPVPRKEQVDVELPVREHSEIARDFVERHKTYRKVLRAASCSSVLFFLSMLFYNVFKGARETRYRWAHFVVTVVLYIFFTSAFCHESTHYHEYLIKYNDLIRREAECSAFGL